MFARLKETPLYQNIKQYYSNFINKPDLSNTETYHLDPVLIEKYLRTAYVNDTPIRVTIKHQNDLFTSHGQVEFIPANYDAFLVLDQQPTLLFKHQVTNIQIEHA